MSAFRFFGADVLLIAFGVTFTVSLLKKTVLKSLPKKAFVFLPFLVGLVYYALWRVLITLSWEPLAGGFAVTLEGGFACGCAATLYYVVYEQFLRKKKVSPLLPLLGFLPEDKRETAAQELYQGALKTEREEREEYFRSALPAYCDPPMSEEELSEIAKLLADYLLELGL